MVGSQLALGLMLMLQDSLGLIPSSSLGSGEDDTVCASSPSNA